MKNLIALLMLFVLGCSSSIEVKPPVVEKAVPTVKSLRDKTVVLVAKDDSGKFTSFCSGIWLEEKWILTAYHCVDGVLSAFHPELLHDDGSEPNYIGQSVNYRSYSDYLRDHEEPRAARARNAIVMRVEAATDLALLKADGNAPEHTNAALRSAVVNDGDDVLVVGHSVAMHFSLSKGIVSASRKMSDLTLLQLSVAAAPGNSGGPVFDSDGNLIGVISFGNTRAQLMTFATHRDSIDEFLKLEELASF